MFAVSVFFCFSSNSPILLYKLGPSKQILYRWFRNWVRTIYCCSVCSRNLKETHIRGNICISESLAVEIEPESLGYSSEDHKPDPFIISDYLRFAIYSMG